MEENTLQAAEVTKATRGRRKGAVKAAGVVTATRRGKTAAPKTTRGRRKLVASAASKAPRKATAGRKKGGRRKAASAQPPVTDSVMITLEIDGKQATVSVAAAKNLYASLAQLFG